MQAKDIIKFRRLKSSDLPRLLEIERACFAYPWSVESFRGTLSKEYVSIGAFSAMDLVGYLIGMVVLDEIHIINVAVDPEYQRNGIAGALMDYTFEQLAGKIRLAYLEVRVTNQPALNLYKKRGFLIVGLCKHYYPDGEDAILMTLDLDEGSKPGYY